GAAWAAWTCKSGVRRRFVAERLPRQPDRGLLRQPFFMGATVGRWGDGGGGGIIAFVACSEALVDRAPLSTLHRRRAGPRARPRRPSPRGHHATARPLERHQRRRAQPPLGDRQGAQSR